MAEAPCYALRRIDSIAGEAVDLAVYEDPLKAALNRGSDQPTIDRLRLSLGNAAGTDSGCTERSARRGAPETAPFHENAH